MFLQINTNILSRKPILILNQLTVLISRIYFDSKYTYINENDNTVSVNNVLKSNIL